MRRAAILVMATLAAPGAAAAQNSVYGMIGIGFPGDALAARARALGGGIAAGDPFSAVNPATVAVHGQLVAGGSAATALRRYTAGDSSVTGLRETRFPYGVFGGRIPNTGLSFAVSFSTYAERTYDITTTGTQVLRGDTITVTDRVASDGAVTDFRGALAIRPWSRLLVGGAFHLLGGSNKLIVGRSFSNTSYAPYTERSQLSFSGIGVSAGVVLLPTNAIELAASVRVDDNLEIRREQATVGSVRLPTSLTGGLRLSPIRPLTLATSVTRRSWSRAQADLVSPSRAFDTWEIGSGLELSRLRARGVMPPIRLGVRYRQLPFSNVATQPTETAFTGGTGLVLAGGRAGFDAAVERFHRSGGGADEQGWYFTLGVTIIP